MKINAGPSLIMSSRLRALKPIPAQSMVGKQCRMTAGLATVLAGNQAYSSAWQRKKIITFPPFSIPLFFCVFGLWFDILESV